MFLTCLLNSGPPAFKRNSFGILFHCFGAKYPKEFNPCFVVFTFGSDSVIQVSTFFIFPFLFCLFFNVAIFVHHISVKKTTERAKVTFPYEPENADELRLVEGEIVTILNKETTEGSGWWEGEVNGKAGMFPSNFVMLLTSEDEVKVRNNRL